MTSPTLTCSVASADLPLLHNAQDSAQSDSARLSLTPAAFSRTDSPGSQTSETCETEALLPGFSRESSALDTRVSLKASAEKDSGLTILAGSGRQCANFCEWEGPLGLLVKTCLATYPADSTRFWPTWKLSVTPRNRLLFQLVPLEPRTCEIASGFLPTPAARDGKDVSRSNAFLAARTRHTPSLATECLIRGMPWRDIPEVYAAAMGYPSKWCDVSYTHTATPSSRKSRNRSSAGSRKSKGAS